MPMTTDDGIREVHGVRCRYADFTNPQSIVIRETDDGVHMSKPEANALMTEWQARYLASRLYRLARRIRQRREAAETGQ